MKTLNNYITERLNPKHLGSADTLPEKLKEKYNLIYNPKTDKYDCNGDIKVEKNLIKNGYFICNFGVVGGNFNCSECQDLISLKGSPEEVGGSFNCSECDKLTSLEGAPEKVGVNFYCWNCKKLTSLEGAPKEVGGKFSCWRCKSLTSLEGAPEKVGGDFDCYSCPKLKDYNINTKIGGKFIK